MGINGGARASKEVEWRERLARFAASGQTAKQFSQQEGVSRASLCRWRGLLGQEATARPDGRFIEVDVGSATGAPNAMQTQAVGLEVRLELGHGLVLHIVRR